MEAECLSLSKRFANTDALQEAAQFFRDNGFYTDAVPETPEYYDFWRRERKRCLKGHKAGGISITGYHYFYLNYSQMDRVGDDELLKFTTSGKDGKLTGVEKIKDFPAFWDGDYDYFWTIEIARFGISKKKYERLKLGVEITNLAGGQHIVILKSRGKGFSYKNASMLTRNFNLKRGSKNYAMAEEKEYLIKDGLLSKTWQNISFIDEHTAWRQPRLKDQDIHKMSGYKRNINGTDVIRGTLNEIIGVTLKDDPDRARGKRGELVFFEESGKLPGLLKAWELCRPAVEQGALTAGIMIAFGTGGTDEALYEGLEELFFHPEANNIIPIKNQWDEGAEDTLCSFFVPAYMNWEGFMDADGNSDIKGAIRFHKHQRELRKKSKDNSALSQYTCEHPFNPQEATLQSNINLFPVVELTAQKNSVIAHKRHHAISVGILFRDSKAVVKFKPTDKVSAINDFPLRKGDDENGAICILEAPHRDQAGRVPRGLYLAGHDPYATDKSSTSGSLGATYIIKRPNNLSTTLNDCIVASYVGRPNTQDEYNRNMYMLAEYYGCKIGFENDRGDVIGYGKRFRLLHWLEEEFEMLDKKELQSRRVNRPYGMHMTEGRKNQGEIYIRDWLTEPMQFNDDGEPTLLRLNTILDIALLTELIKFNRKGNFDRVMALMVAMYHRKELHNANVSHEEDDRHEEFFARELYA